MRRVTLLLGLALVIGALSTAARAADGAPGTPVSDYGAETSFSLMQCGMTFKLAVAQAKLASAKGDDGQPPADYAGCISEARTSSKKALDSALRSVKKPKARDALKSYHAVYVTALQGIVPGADERQISYEQRQQALQDKVTEAWARFEVEQ